MSSIACAALPDGFIYLSDMAPDIQQDMRYAGHSNFIGRPINGYKTARCVLTRQAAAQLAKVQIQLKEMQMSLKVWDCYRPQQAVNDFHTWSLDATDQKNKSTYYPDIDKAQLFAKGYISEKSGHSRGSTVDLTVVAIGGAAKKYIPGNFHVNSDLDMGTPFDWFGVESNTENPDVSPAAQANRRWFRHVMQTHGFYNLPEEWWHFTLRQEPFPSTFFDFPVE
ncbi:M15 family metallopeptidase [Chromobacterium haemolyticum]|uniref:M15 family metallopeptidase n=1 Tax=Chromobacterium haemolyticum TaxID=394935 RepID=UPI001C4E096C|nr:M15 family metallopeptidase [Chromobacterium haemolyticum]